MPARTEVGDPGRTHLGARAARVGALRVCEAGVGVLRWRRLGGLRSRGSRPLATARVPEVARPAPPDVTSDRSQDGGGAAAGAGAGGAVAAVRAAALGALRRGARRAQPGKKQPGRVASGTAAGSAPGLQSLSARSEAAAAAGATRRGPGRAGPGGPAGAPPSRSQRPALAAPPAMRRGPRAAGVRPSRAEHPGPALGPGAGKLWGPLCRRWLAARPAGSTRVGCRAAAPGGRLRLQRDPGPGPARVPTGPRAVPISSDLVLLFVCSNRTCLSHLHSEFVQCFASLCFLNPQSVV